MAYASNSFGGGCPPTYLVSAINSSAMTATFSDLTGWVEVDAAGAKTNQPLGTSGSFCIKLDYGLATEETVKCTSLNPSTGVITFATRGFDGTTAQAHVGGSAAKLNVFPTETATDWINLQATATTASTTASSALSAASTAQSTANGKVASVTAADATITIAGTGTAPTVKVGTVPYGQVSGTPTALPPNGTAGGDLTGTYPNPTLAAAGTAGTYGSGSLVPVITTDSKGRVTLVTTSAPLDATKLPLAGGTMSGAIAMGASKITGLANGTASSDAAAFGQIPAALPPNGSAGGDLTGTYPNPTVTAGSTSVAGKLQLTDSTSSTSTTTAATPNSVKTAYDLANAALPKSGGTMTGAIAMGSNRITGMPTPGASTDPLIASQSMGAPNPSIHTPTAVGTYSMKAWNADPANCALSTASVSMTSGTEFFSAITIPYPTTLNQIWVYQITGAAYQATSPYYALGIYDTTGNLLASTGNVQPAGFTGLTGALGWGLTASYSIAAGNYMIGFLYYSGTGAGTPITPALGRLNGAVAAGINMNCPTPSAGKLDQRCCSTGSRTTLASPMTATPVISATNFWVGVA